MAWVAGACSCVDCWSGAKRAPGGPSGSGPADPDGAVPMEKRSEEYERTQMGD